MPAITAVSLFGIDCVVFGMMLFQLKVLIATMIMTATSAAIGIWATKVAERHD